MAAAYLGSVSKYLMSDIIHAQSANEERTADAVAQGENPVWYAVRVRPRAEKLVAAALRGKQYEEFLPLYQKRSRWSDRVKLIDCPLFPGYVFCRGDMSGRPPLVTTPSVIGILSFGGRPALIFQEEIEAIKAVLRSGLNSEPWPYLREGDRVRIIHGSLAGVEGVLVRAKTDWRVVLSVDVLCRSIAVEIDRAWAAPVTSSKTFRYAC
jgi:transcription antitermination factor NusG